MYDVTDGRYIQVRPQQIASGDIPTLLIDSSRPASTQEAARYHPFATVGAGFLILCPTRPLQHLLDAHLPRRSTGGGIILLNDHTLLGPPGEL